MKFQKDESNQAQSCRPRAKESCHSERFSSLKSHHIAKTVFVNFRSTFKELLVELGIIVKPNQVFAITIGSGVLAREFTLDTEKNKDMLLIDMGLAEESFIEIMDEKIKRKAKPKLSSATPNGK